MKKLIVLGMLMACTGSGGGSATTVDIRTLFTGNTALIPSESVVRATGLASDVSTLEATIQVFAEDGEALLDTAKSDIVKSRINKRTDWKGFSAYYTIQGQNMFRKLTSGETGDGKDLGAFVYDESTPNVISFPLPGLINGYDNTLKATQSTTNSANITLELTVKPEKDTENANNNWFIVYNPNSFHGYDLVQTGNLPGGAHTKIGKIVITPATSYKSGAVVTSVNSKFTEIRDGAMAMIESVEGQDIDSTRIGIPVEGHTLPGTGTEAEKAKEIAGNMLQVIGDGVLKGVMFANMALNPNSICNTNFAVAVAPRDQQGNVTGPPEEVKVDTAYSGIYTETSNVISMIWADLPAPGIQIETELTLLQQTDNDIILHVHFRISGTPGKLLKYDDGALFKVTPIDATTTLNSGDPVIVGLEMDVFIGEEVAE